MPKNVPVQPIKLLQISLKYCGTFAYNIIYVTLLFFKVGKNNETESHEISMKFIRVVTNSGKKCVYFHTINTSQGISADFAFISSSLFADFVSKFYIIVNC